MVLERYSTASHSVMCDKYNIYSFEILCIHFVNGCVLSKANQVFVVSCDIFRTLINSTDAVEFIQNLLSGIIDVIFIFPCQKRTDSVQNAVEATTSRERIRHEWLKRHH